MFLEQMIVMILKSLRICCRVWDDVPTMKPLSGAEYTIWPVIHTTLVQKKLQTVECEEVGHRLPYACRCQSPPPVAALTQTAHVACGTLS